MIKPLVIATTVLLLSGCMQPYANIKADARIWSPRTQPQQAPQPSPAPATATSPMATPPEAAPTQKAIRPAPAVKQKTQTADAVPVIKILTPVDTNTVRSRPVSISVD